MVPPYFPIILLSTSSRAMGPNVGRSELVPYWLVAPRKVSILVCEPLHSLQIAFKLQALKESLTIWTKKMDFYIICKCFTTYGLHNGHLTCPFSALFLVSTAPLD